MRIVFGVAFVCCVAQRVERCARLPELGPKVLFFSGGSALREVSKRLKLYTHNSIHLVTPFDSGGSSAVIRTAFDCIAVGDVRNRLMALAEDSLFGTAEIVQLAAFRLDRSKSQAALREELSSMVDGSHPLVEAVPSPVRQIVCSHLHWFARAIIKSPSPRLQNFDLRGASIGNLLLVGGYLANQRNIDAVCYMFSQLVTVLGVVRPTCDENLHLRCTHRDSEEPTTGQHKMGKPEVLNKGPITSIELVKCAQLEANGPSTTAEGQERAQSHKEQQQQSQSQPQPLLNRQEFVPANAALDQTRFDLIASADLVVFPIGSFFTSLMPNLLVSGVGRAVAACRCPKVYVPNSSSDPEMMGHTVADCVAMLLAQLRRDAGEDTPTSDLLNFVLVDSRRVHYGHELDRAAVEACGVQLVDVDLATSASIDCEPRGERAGLANLQTQVGPIDGLNRKEKALDPDKVCRVLVTLGG